MINPDAMVRMMGYDPAKVREIGKHLTVTVVKDRAKGRLVLQYQAKSPGVDVGQMVDAMAGQIATLSYTMFGITGEIQEVE